MSDPNQPQTPAGWYPDGQGNQRWWDGTQWTEHSQPMVPDTPPAPAAPATPATPSLNDQETVVAPYRAASQEQPPGQQPHGAPGQQWGPPAQPPAQPYGAHPGQQPWAQPAPGAGPFDAGSGAFGAGAGPFNGPGQPYGAASYPAPNGGSGGNKRMFVILGSALAALIAIVLVIVVLIRLLGGAGPDAVAEEYLQASADFDTEAICELTSRQVLAEEFASRDVDNCDDLIDETEDEIDSELEDVKEGFESATGESYDDFLDDVDHEIEIKDVAEDGDTAHVDWETRSTYDGDNEAALQFFSESGGATQEASGTMLVCKEDGDWKVRSQYSSTDEDC